MASSKLIACRTCGAMIARNASVCPQCGGRNKPKRHPVLGILIALIGLALLISGIVGSSGGTKGLKPIKDYAVGETATLNDVSVTLVEVKESKGDPYLGPADGNVYLICEFEIANDSGKEIVLSSLLGFSAYCDDYATQLNIVATTSTDLPQLDGTIAPGKRIDGVIGYEVPKTWKQLELRFKPDFWSGKQLTFFATH